MADNSRAHSLICQTKPWATNENSVWLASTVALSRNIERFKFPGRLSGDLKKQILSLIEKVPLDVEGLVHPILVRADEMSPLEKEYLGEHFLSVNSFQNAALGEGFIVDESGEFLASLNLQDHIQFLLIDRKGELEHTWNRLAKIEMAMGQSMTYSFSQKFGFLTSNPTQCGTALVATVYLQIPGMIHSGKIDAYLEEHTDEAINITGIHGNPVDIIGDILMIQNNYTLGLTEETILSSIRHFVTKLLAEEHSARQAIKTGESSDVKDIVSRAYAILVHSYQIEAVEALNAISLLKLGLEMDWVEGVSLMDLNRLFFNCRRAHLLEQFGEKVSQEDILHKRAEYIHKTLKNLKLKI